MYASGHTLLASRHKSILINIKSNYKCNFFLMYKIDKFSIHKIK